MAYTSDESGRSQVYVQPFPPSGGKWQISTTSGAQPIWRRDGQELFYLDLEGNLMATEIKLGSTFQAGVPKPLFKVNTLILGTRNSYVPSNDGRRFLVNSYVDNTSGSPISVVVNWASELR
jgi:Tol biopolymer transport system component